MSSVETATLGLEIDSSGLESGTKRAESALAQLASRMGAVEGGAAKLSGVFSGSLAGSLAGLALGGILSEMNNLAASLGQLARESIETAVKFDSLKQSLTAITGSAALAGEEFSRLKELAKLPGLGFEEAVKGSVNLQAVGFSALEAERTLKAMSNAIALTGGGRQDLDAVLVQITQMSSRSKVLAEDLKPILGRAPILGKVLKEAFGSVSAEEIAAQSKGFDDFFERLLKGLEKLPSAADTPRNVLDNLADSFTRLEASFGAGIVRSVLPDLKDLTTYLEGSEKAATAAGIAFGQITGTLGSVIKRFDEFGDSILKAIGQQDRSFTKDIQGIGEAFAILTDAVELAAASTKLFGEEHLTARKRLDEGFKTLHEYNKTTQDAAAAQAALTGELNSTNDALARQARAAQEAADKLRGALIAAQGGQTGSAKSLLQERFGQALQNIARFGDTPSQIKQNFETFRKQNAEFDALVRDIQQGERKSKVINDLITPPTSTKGGKAAESERLALIREQAKATEIASKNEFEKIKQALSDEEDYVNRFYDRGAAFLDDYYDIRASIISRRTNAEIDQIERSIRALEQQRDQQTKGSGRQRVQNQIDELIGQRDLTSQRGQSALNAVNAERERTIQDRRQKAFEELGAVVEKVSENYSNLVRNGLNPADIEFENQVDLLNQLIMKAGQSADSYSKVFDQLKAIRDLQKQDEGMKRRAQAAEPLDQALSQLRTETLRLTKGALDPLDAQIEETRKSMIQLAIATKAGGAEFAAFVDKIDRGLEEFRKANEFAQFRSDIRDSFQGAIDGITKLDFRGAAQSFFGGLAEAFRKQAAGQLTSVIDKYVINPLSKALNDGLAAMVKRLAGSAVVRALTGFLTKLFSGLFGGAIGGAIGGGGAVGGGDWANVAEFGHFATGGEMGAGGWAMVGENGPEMVFTKPGGGMKVFNNRQTQEMMSGGGGGNTFHININGVTDFRSFQRSQDQVALEMGRALERAKRNS